MQTSLILPEFHVRTARMLMRPLRASDCQMFVRMHELSREHFAPWSPVSPAGQTFDELFEQQLQRGQSGLASGKDCRLAAFLDDGRMVGLFNLNEIIRGAFQNAFAGWKVSAEFTRQGYGTEAVQALLDLAFAPPPAGLGLHRVQANIIPANLPSLALAERCGFRREGLAKAYLNIAGQWQDHVMCAKLAEEHGGGN